MSRGRVAPVIHLTVRPCDGGQVVLQLQHPKGYQSVLYLDPPELAELQQALDDASQLANPAPIKPRIAVTLIRNKE